MHKSIFRKILILVIALTCVAFLTGDVEHIIGNEQQHVHLLYLKHRVLEFARKYSDQDVIVVSKQDHLLYYCKDGKIVKNEQWNGFTYNFPVKVALASKYHWTPEGEMYIDGKNPKSRYIRFLSFSGPGAYGIHSAATRFASYLDKMEKKNPNFEFATLRDDTRGCVQVENRVIRYLFSKVDTKTPVLVLP